MLISLRPWILCCVSMDARSRMKRLGDILGRSDLEVSSPVADRLKQTKLALQDILDSEYTIKDLMLIDITMPAPNTENPRAELQTNERIEIELQCLTKRPIKYIKDLLHSGLYGRKDVYLTDGSGIRFAREVDGKMNIIVSNNVSDENEEHFLHIYKDDRWTKFPFVLKNQLQCVTAHLPQTTMVCVTMPCDYTSTLNPEEGFSYICPENKNVMLEFPAGCTSSTQEISIHLEPVLIDQCKYPLTEIQGYSDVVHIQHDEEFLKPIKVTLPLTLIGDKDISAYDLFCVHIDDNGLIIKDDVKVEHLDGNICCFETISFPSNTVHAKRRRHSKPRLRDQMRKLIKQLQKLHGASPHIFLLFIGAGSEAKTWKLHAEVVDESDINSTVTRRREEMSIIPLSSCRSQSICIRDIKQIKVTLGSKGSLRRCKSVMQHPPVINIIQGAENNFVAFPVTRKTEGQPAIVLFTDVKRRKVIYTAFFDPREMNYCIMPQPSDSHRIGIIPGTISGTARPVQTGDEKVLTTVSHASSTSSIDVPDSPLPVQSSGFFSDKSMLLLTKQISMEDMFQLSIHLDIPHRTYKDLKAQHKDPNELRLGIIQHWVGNLTCSEEEMKSILCDALEEVPLPRIKSIVESVFEQKRAFKNSDFRN